MGWIPSIFGRNENGEFTLTDNRFQQKDTDGQHRRPQAMFIIEKSKGKEIEDKDKAFAPTWQVYLLLKISRIKDILKEIYCITSSVTDKNFVFKPKLEELNTQLM